MPEISASAALAADLNLVPRYHLKRSGFHWTVLCGTGTRVIYKSFRWINAARMASNLNSAHADGKWVYEQFQTKQTNMVWEVTSKSHNSFSYLFASKELADSFCMRLPSFLGLAPVERTVVNRM